MKDSVRYKDQFALVDGVKIHYIEEGEGIPILFLHGVPTSSYVWRKVFPHLSILGRCIAPDLIGFGQSDKPDINYTIVDHIHYIEAFIKQLKLEKMIIVMHGFGSIIALDIAMRYEKNVKGLVFYESFIRPFEADTEVSLPFREQIKMVEEENELELASNQTDFVDRLLSQNIMAQLSDEALVYYRESFKNENSMKPILQYFKSLSNEKSRQEINQIIEPYVKKLIRSQIPKLMLYSVPGFLTTIEDVMWAQKNIPHLEIVDVGEELHLGQESNPALIGESISAWMQAIEQK